MRLIHYVCKFDLNHMIPGHVYLLSVRDQRKEVYGILLKVKEQEAVFSTVIGTIGATPDEVVAGRLDIKEVRIAVDEELEDMELEGVV